MTEPTLAAAAGGDPLAPLLSRHSLGGKHLDEPGPDDAALARMVQVALRAPDHAGLVPWRLAVVRGEARARLGALFADAARDAGKDEAAAALDVERARQVPVTLALIARIDLGHPQVPAHEQWIAVGGALANLMNAAHLLGYAGKMLSGHKARHPRVQAAFCGPGETLVGWITLGSARRAVRGRERLADPARLCTDW